MGQYICRHVTSVIMFLIAFILLLVGLMTSGWYVNANTGSSSIYFLQYYGSSYSYGSVNDGSGYSSAAVGTLITAISLTALCLVFSTVMMFADCCCRVTKCMAVIPRITIASATVAGILAEIACILFLIQIYAVVGRANVVPSYSFYLVTVAGISLQIVGCINCGVRHGTRVDNVDEVVTITASQMQGGTQLLSTPVMYSTNSMPPIGMMPPGGMVPTQGYSPAAPAFYNNNAPLRIKVFVTNEATQTSFVDLKKAVNK